MGITEELRSFLLELEKETPTLEFTEELRECGIVVFRFPQHCLNLVAVPLEFFEVQYDGSSPLHPAPDTIHIFEDRWRSMGTVIRGRLRAHLGLQKNVFARNCEVRPISAQTAAAFLDQYHAYGSTKAKFRYGLFRRRATGAGEAPMTESATLIAVATFSAPRVMPSQGNTSDAINTGHCGIKPSAEHGEEDNSATTMDPHPSCEWERYASLPEFRVVGGMGKLLNHFIEEQHPDEVVTYADLEWSDGTVYSKLGFHPTGFRAPVSFIIDPATFRRISTSKIGRDRRFSKADSIQNSSIIIHNLGSQKFSR